MHLPNETHGAVNARFVAGNPLTGQRATIWTAELCNAVVEEPANVIRAAGLELDRTDNTQLLQALQLLIDERIAAALEGFSGGSSTGGSSSCESVRDILAQYARVENGRLVITCPVDPNVDPDPDPKPPVTGSYVIVNPNTSTLQMRVEGEAAFAAGALTLTDAALETYAIAANLLTITEA
jgi:hypothetical protein